MLSVARQRAKAANAAIRIHEIPLSNEVPPSEAADNYKIAQLYNHFDFSLKNEEVEVKIDYRLLSNLENKIMTNGTCAGFNYSFNINTHVAERETWVKDTSNAFYQLTTLVPDANFVRMLDATPVEQLARSLCFPKHDYGQFTSEIRGVLKKGIKSVGLGSNIIMRLVKGVLLYMMASMGDIVYTEPANVVRRLYTPQNIKELVESKKEATIWSNHPKKRGFNSVLSLLCSEFPPPNLVGMPDRFEKLHIPGDAEQICILSEQEVLLGSQIGRAHV